MLRAVTALAITLTAASAIADVYKYTDANGNVQYTDTPQTLPAQRLNVQSQRTDTVALSKRLEEENKRNTENAKARQNTTSQAADQKQAEQLSATDKAERCAKARERYDKYMNSQRLYEESNGERRYLSDVELDAARASAKASMDTLCN